MKRVVVAVLVVSGASALLAGPQGMGSVGGITGTVTDPSGAVVPGATVEVQSQVSGYDKTVKTDPSGAFKVLDLAPNNYHVAVTASGFQPQHLENISVRAGVPSNLSISLTLASST